MVSVKYFRISFTLKTMNWLTFKVMSQYFNIEKNNIRFLYGIQCITLQNIPLEYKNSMK